jgi:hypothetical protein
VGTKAAGGGGGISEVKWRDVWEFNPDVDPDWQRRSTYAEPS